MRKFLNRLLKRSPHPARAFWNWAGRAMLKNEGKRWKALANLATYRQHEAAKRANAADKRFREAKTRAVKDKAIRDRRRAWRTFRRWGHMRGVYKAQRRKARRRWKRHQKPDQPPGYATWMLSGHGANIDDDLKPVVAFLVVVRGQTISDTYDYSGHAPSSYHYPRNDPTPPQQGRAVDSYGPDMCGSATATRDHFGAAHLLELFSPCPWYIKNGQQLGGYFPGHGDHQHTAVA